MQQIFANTPIPIYHNTARSTTPRNWNLTSFQNKITRFEGLYVEFKPHCGNVSSSNLIGTSNMAFTVKEMCELKPVMTSKGKTYRRLEECIIASEKQCILRNQWNCLVLVEEFKFDSKGA